MMKRVMPPGVTEVSGGVFRLGSRFVNFYIIAEGGRFTVIDGGLPGHLGQVLELLRSVGGSPHNVEAVLLTHAHPDHLGVAEPMRREGATVFAHEADRGRAVRKRPPLPPGGLVRNLWRRPVRTSFKSFGDDGIGRLAQPAECEEFHDGERLPVPGSPLVIRTSGHTDGSCAFLLVERGLLFTGDALCTLHPYTGAAGPLVLPHGLNKDDRRAYESLQVLRACSADLVLPGHGDPWRDGVQQAVALAERRFSK